MSTARNDFHIHTTEGELGVVQGMCSCGWEGKEFQQWQDLAYALAKDDWKEHVWAREAKP